MPQVTPPADVSPWHDRHLLASVAALVAGVIIAGALIGGSYFLSGWEAHRTAQQVATQVEQARAEVLEKAQQAETVAITRECKALEGLAAISGSHVPDATYGYHLETGIRNVYEQSGCPALLAGRSGQ